MDKVQKHNSFNMRRNPCPCQEANPVVQPVAWSLYWPNHPASQKTVTMIILNVKYCAFILISWAFIYQQCDLLRPGWLVFKCLQEYWGCSLQKHIQDGLETLPASEPNGSCWSIQLTVCRYLLPWGFPSSHPYALMLRCLTYKNKFLIKPNYIVLLLFQGRSLCSGIYHFVALPNSFFLRS
jgi:hypothetical protein